MNCSAFVVVIFLLVTWLILARFPCFLCLDALKMQLRIFFGESRVTLDVRTNIVIIIIVVVIMFEIDEFVVSVIHTTGSGTSPNPIALSIPIYRMPSERCSRAGICYSVSAGSPVKLFASICAAPVIHFFILTQGAGHVENVETSLKT